MVPWLVRSGLPALVNMPYELFPRVMMVPRFSESTAVMMPSNPGEFVSMVP